MCQDVQDPRNSLTQEEVALYMRMGMTPAAVHLWALWHVKPARAIAYHFGAQLVLLGACTYLLTGNPLSKLYYSVPLSAAILLQLLHIGAAWRFGPNLSLNPFIKGSLPGPNFNS
jgi:hypothetical protein